jgi:4-hydroxythreonine-4-phosphate dehydrogenase
MKKIIAIIVGEPNSISSEIIFKSWILRNKYKHKKFFIIGNFKLLNLQKEKLKFKIKLKEIKKNFCVKDLDGNHLPVFNVKYNQNKPFEKISKKTNKFIFNCFEESLDFIKKKKISGLINCPVVKETLFKDNYQGVTEYLSNKTSKINNPVMLIFSKELSVSPLTTHIPISSVKNQINQKKIIENIILIDKFFKNFLNKKPKIAILGLNPHNYYSKNHYKEKKIINNAVLKIRKNKINIVGPISPDTSFMIAKKYKFDVIIGMYHDQVLTPFKAVYGFKAINITLGLPFVRISPDHGVAENITGKGIASPVSLIESIKFFNYL